TRDLRLHVECAEAAFRDLDQATERTFAVRSENDSNGARPARWHGVPVDAFTEGDAELGIGGLDLVRHERAGPGVVQPYEPLTAGKAGDPGADVDVGDRQLWLLGDADDLARGVRCRYREGVV